MGGLVSTSFVILKFIFNSRNENRLALDWAVEQRLFHIDKRVDDRSDELHNQHDAVATGGRHQTSELFEAY